MGQIERADAITAMSLLTDMPMGWNDNEQVSIEAVRLEMTVNLPVYDCVYLALARYIGAKVVTADRRFVRAVEATMHGGFVMTLTDYAAKA